MEGCAAVKLQLPKSLRRGRTERLIDPELQTVDRLCDAWARDGYYGSMGSGGMNPLEVLRLLAEGQVIGGAVSNDEIMIAVDQSILKAPARYKSTLTVWYKTPHPVEVKAKRLGLSRTALYTEWKMALAYLRGALHARGISV